MKRAKKGSGESVSTLMRRARTAKPAEAKRLRAKAATMRKAKRASVVADALAPAAEVQVVKVIRKDWADAGKAMRAESINDMAKAPSAADYLDVMARDLIVAARKKGAEQAITNDLMQLAASMRFEGRASAERANAAFVKEIRHANQETAIAGFLAMASRRTSVSELMTIGSITIDAIVDALNERKS